VAGKSIIPEGLWPEILAQSAGGWSTRKIADWLLQVHHLQVSHEAVAAMLRRQRQQREGIAGELVRERLSRTVLLDIDALKREGRRIRKLCRLLFREVEEGNTDQAIPYLKGG
jgi:hypothetical protein